jgi:hypothetical protein
MRTVTRHLCAATAAIAVTGVSVTLHVPDDRAPQPRSVTVEDAAPPAR